MTKRKSKGRKSKKVSTDFGVVITIIFSILLTVLIYTESGYIGIMLSDFFGGMFGIIKYVLPIGSFAVAIKMACKNDDGYISSRIFQYSLLLIFIAVILSVYQTILVTLCNKSVVFSSFGIIFNCQSRDKVATTKHFVTALFQIVLLVVINTDKDYAIIAK